jgi:RPN1 N-terminal domain
MTLVEAIVPYHMTHNAEPEAVDLLLEVCLSFGASKSNWGGEGVLVWS